MIPLNYNLRSLAVRKTTTFATVFGVSLVVFVLASSQMLANGIRNTLGKSGDPNRAIVLRKGADSETQSTIEAPLASIVSNAPGVARDAAGQPQALAALLFVMMFEKAGTQGQISSITLRGVPDSASDSFPELKIVKGRAPRAGSEEVIVGKQLEGRVTGLKLGGRFEIKKNHHVEVVGVFTAGGSSHESEIITDLDLVRRSFGLEGLVSSITVTLESPSKFEAFRATVEQDKRLGVTALREPDYYAKQADGTVTLVTALGIAVVVLFSLGASIGAMITMYASVARRKREVATLRALGFSPRTVLASFLLEAVLLALCGGVIGALASLVTRFFHFSLVNLNSGSEISFSFDPSPTILGVAVLVGGAVGVLGGFLPAIQASRMSPAAAMRS